MLNNPATFACQKVSSFQETTMTTVKQRTLLRKNNLLISKSYNIFQINKKVSFYRHEG